MGASQAVARIIPLLHNAEAGAQSRDEVIASRIYLMY